ncbi:MAG: hypothetical protein ACYTER_05065 [Planctomycetota bacterium]|jgi:hypothetical protein
MSQLMTKLVHFILIALLVCNGYGNVVCFGSDGHIAIEPAFHDHCATSHDHGHGHHHHSDTAHRDETESCLDVSCSPCTDMLITTDLEPARLQTSTQSEVAHSGIDLKTVADSYNHHCYECNVDPFSYFTPLETIILLT